MIILRLIFLVALVAALPVQLDANDGAIIGLNKRGFWSSVISLFNGDTSASTAATTTTAAAAAPAVTVATPATVAPVATANTVATAAAVTAAVTATTAASSNGWLADVLSLLGAGRSSSAVAQATAAPVSVVTVTATLAATPTILATSSASTQSVGLGLGQWVSALAGGSATSTSTSQSPGFTGLVTVVGAGGTSPSAAASASAAASGSVSSSGSGTASNSQIQAVANYAEMGAGISYSPYTKSGTCKTAAEVKQDIALLSAYPLLRLYSVDCSGVQNVVAAMSSSQKLFLGIWDISAIATDLPSMQQQVLTGSRGWSAVHTVAIGNEVVNAGTNTVAQVASAVASARSWFKQNASAYTGYIVAVDTLSATMANQGLCDISDYLAVNCHPYFSGIEASTSGTWLKQQIASLQSFCGGSKQVLITESGWPTQGNTEGQAVPSVANQLSAIKGLGTEVGTQVMMFTTFNDYWKAPGAWNVEQHWGIYGDPDY